MSFRTRMPGLVCLASGLALLLATTAISADEAPRKPAPSRRSAEGATRDFNIALEIEVAAPRAGLSLLSEMPYVARLFRAAGQVVAGSSPVQQDEVCQLPKESDWTPPVPPLPLASPTDGGCIFFTGPAGGGAQGAIVWENAQADAQPPRFRLHRAQPATHEWCEPFAGWFNSRGDASCPPSASATSRRTAHAAVLTDCEEVLPLGQEEPAHIILELMQNGVPSIVLGRFLEGLPAHCQTGEVCCDIACGTQCDSRACCEQTCPRQTEADQGAVAHDGSVARCGTDCRCAVCPDGCACPASASHAQRNCPLDPHSRAWLSGYIRRLQQTPHHGPPQYVEVMPMEGPLAGAPIPPQPTFAMPPQPPMAMPLAGEAPAQSVGGSQTLRHASRDLDRSAARLEEDGLYHQADMLREVAHRLRHEARAARHAGHMHGLPAYFAPQPVAPVYPQPVDPAVLQELEQLRAEVHRLRQALRAPVPPPYGVPSQQY